MAAWINEFHYDNTGADAGEFIEIAGAAGTDLTGWSLVLYNGNPSQLTSYSTTALSGTIANQANGFGTVSVAITGIQNGNTLGTEPDGIALVNAGGTVVQFLSYEGVFTASGGPAGGMTSTNIGIFQASTEAAGSSLHLVGTGDEYADFTWAATTDDSPGAVNAGQNFTGGGGETLAISDASVSEGNAGTATLTFTVTRSGNTGAFTVDFATANGTATAGSDYLANSGTLTFTAGGGLSQTVSVTVNGDVAAETDETLTVGLANLVNATGTTTIADASGTGTIVNDEIVFTEIAAIQGAGHRSALAAAGTIGQSTNSGSNRYNVEGVVTGITTNGFWMQDATPDADIATSDGIFVFTSTAPAGTLTIGETVRVLAARVDEFRLGSATNNLTITELNVSVSGASLVELGGNTAIAAVRIGTGGRLPPAGAIDDDSFASFDPTTDAIDFWESLEGMVVQILNPVAVSITNEFRTRDPANSANAEGPPNEEIWVLAQGSYDPATLSSRGAPLLGATDGNPERIQIDDMLASLDLPDVSVGARLSSVTGIVNYDFTNYEILTTTAPTVTRPSRLTAETTTITRDARQLTIGSYNVENLDAEVEDTAVGSVTGSDLYTRLGNSDDDVGSGKYAAHAAQIALNLGAPVIVALQEVQDNDGAEISSDVDAMRTLQTLVDLIQANHGITYAFAYANPTASNTDGGQPNANIRPAFLYRPDLVTLLDATPGDPTTMVRRHTDPNPGEADGFAGDDFASSRKPLEAMFAFNGQVVTIINNHFNSKGGDNGLYGNAQPPVLSSEAQRIEQARIVNARVDQILAADANANVIVAGDLNDFAWSLPNRTLDGTAGGGTRVLTDLAEALLPANERYSYNFEGSAQTLDHMLVTGNLLNQAAPVFDIVHVNADLATGVSDHDPSVARFDFRALAENLVLGAANDQVEGGGGGDTLAGNDGADRLSGGAGNDSLLGGAGNDRLAGDDGADTLDGGAGNDRLEGGAGNDFYRVDAGDTVREAAAAGTDTVVGAGTIRLAENVEVGMLEGTDAGLLTGNDLGNLLFGNAGANRLLGQGGDDSLAGGGGDDVVIGGLGADTLDGGDGQDRLQGQGGADTFILGTGGFDGDVIADYDLVADRLLVMAATLSPDLAPGALAANRFQANTAGQATATGGFFVFETDARKLWWDADGAGAERTLLASFVGLVGTPFNAGDIFLG
jgi:predicted extracellular nuclease